jgi:hypothetical protein
VNPPRSSNLTEAVAKDEKKSSPWKWIASIVVLVSLFASARLLPVTQWLEAFSEWVGNLGPWGIAIFIGAYVLATVLLLPGSVLTIGAGFVFGLGWGRFDRIDTWRRVGISHLSLHRA